MKKLLLIASTALSINVVAQPITFNKHYGGPYGDEGQYVEQTSDGGYIIAGYYTDPTTFKSSGILLKTNASGDSTWSKLYRPSSSNASFTCVRKTTDGGYVACGTDNITFMNSHWYIVKTNSSGDTLWTKSYGTAYQNQAKFIEPTIDGGYILGGFWQEVSGGSLISKVIKTNAFGDTLWSANIDGGYNTNIIECVRQTTDGGYMLTGVDEKLSGSSMPVVKLSSSGSVLWSKAYQLFSSITYGYSVIQTLDGGYALTGRYGDNSTNNVLLVLKTDANGDSLWSKSYVALGFGPAGPGAQGHSIRQTFDGGYIIGGHATYNLYWPVMYALKTDANGDSLWAKFYGDTNGANTTRGYSIQQTSDSGYVFCGLSTSSSYGQNDIYLIKMDSNGSILTSMQEQSYESLFRPLIYPNPFSSQTTIQTDRILKNATLTVYNCFGQIVKQIKNISGQAVTLQRDNLPSGLYFLRLTEDGKVIATKKILITD